MNSSTENTGPTSLMRRHAVRRPKMPTAAQFQQARKIVGGGHSPWTIEMVIQAASDDLGLPIEKNGIAAIERGEPPPKPTKSTDKQDYLGEQKFYGGMDYDQRLHLVYLALGCIFLPDGTVVWANPRDLWGAFYKLDDAWENTLAGIPGQPDTIDIARTIIVRAFARARK